jgi:hypothetical protein
VLIEYFPDPTPTTPSVLLTYGDLPAEAARLRGAAGQLAAGELRTLRVDHLPGFRSVDGCSLLAEVGDTSLGLAPVEHSSRAFRCVLSAADWQGVVDLLKPFVARNRQTDSST